MRLMIWCYGNWFFVMKPISMKDKFIMINNINKLRKMKLDKISNKNVL
jgi:hypothetical protein